MAPSLAWFRLCLVIFVLLSKKNLPSSALRPGGDDAIALTSAGSIVLDNGSVIEEYELRESNPVLAKFINIGSASHKLLQKSGYAYGVLVGIAHSDRDKEFGEGPDRQEWFPMVLVIEVMEAGADDESEDVTVQYEVVVDFDPKGVAAPGLMILEARKLGTEGAVAAVLEVIPPEPNSFIERNKGGITMFLGVIIASGVVRFIRRGLEELIKTMKKWSGKNKSGDKDIVSSAETRRGKSKKSIKGESSKED